MSNHTIVSRAHDGTGEERCGRPTGDHWTVPSSCWSSAGYVRVSVYKQVPRFRVWSNRQPRSNPYFEVQRGHPPNIPQRNRAANPPGVPDLVVSATDTEMTATILAPQVGGTPTLYRVHFADDGNFANPTERTRADADDETFTGLTSATNYYVRVRAENDDGNSPWQAVAATTEDAPPTCVPDSGLVAQARKYLSDNEQNPARGKGHAVTERWRKVVRAYDAVIDGDSDALDRVQAALDDLPARNQWTAPHIDELNRLKTCLS
ncbi:MAG: fibronectin type III domain-containing protein [Gammaproteobacteria bacterium]|nr:fibronectin type III domain-containing protein [Gammaproteobacteria bacterium]MDE0246685.1 fibronectin type III domain-containing protein [Gammaproteobacteria bacterium]